MVWFTHLWTAAPGLVWCDDEVCCDEEGAVFCRRYDIVRLVPDPLHPGDPIQHWVAIQRTGTEDYVGSQKVSTIKMPIPEKFFAMQKIAIYSVVVLIFYFLIEGFSRNYFSDLYILKSRILSQLLNIGQKQP